MVATIIRGTLRPELNNSDVIHTTPGITVIGMPEGFSILPAQLAEAGEPAIYSLYLKIAAMESFGHEPNHIDLYPPLVDEFGLTDDDYTGAVDTFLDTDAAYLFYQEAFNYLLGQKLITIT